MRWDIKDDPMQAAGEPGPDGRLAYCRRDLCYSLRPCNAPLACGNQKGATASFCTVRNLSKPVEWGGRHAGKPGPVADMPIASNPTTGAKRFDGGSARPARLADRLRSKVLLTRSLAPLKMVGPAP